MTTITTDQTIGLEGTTYTVTTEAGQYLGTYWQGHGSDVVTSADLPAEDQGVVGPIEAIVILAHAAGVRGFSLSDHENVSYGDDLVAEVLRRVESVGGSQNVYIEGVYLWGHDLGVGTIPVMEIISEHCQGEGVAA